MIRILCEPWYLLAFVAFNFCRQDTKAQRITKSENFDNFGFALVLTNKDPMKKLILLIFLFAPLIQIVTGQGRQSALLLIDIQDFYFPGGRSELVAPEKAAENAALILDRFRVKGLTVVHIRHNSEPGGTINLRVKPLENEKIFSKSDVNSFKGTGLHEFLQSAKIDTLVICGMQTHMCVEAAVRAGSDLGYKCILIHDACATKDLKFGDRIIKSEDVHYSTLSTLRSYAAVISTEEFLKDK
jgi:nicotinamidase-related amidase